MCEYSDGIVTPSPTQIPRSLALNTRSISQHERENNLQSLTPSSSASSTCSACSYTSQDLEMLRSGMDQNMEGDGEGGVENGIFHCSHVDLEESYSHHDTSFNDDFWSCDPSVSVSLRVEKSGPSSVPPMTVLELFQKVVQEYGTHLALAVKRAGMWKKWTYAEYYDTCVTVAKAFIKLGLQPYQSVCIIGFNAPEWHISLLSAIMAGGVGAGVYLTSTPEGCCHIATSSKAAIFVVENDSQLEKVLQIKDQLPDLRAIVHYSELLAGKPADDCIMSWSKLMELDTNDCAMELQDRMSLITPNRCCSLIYTSGTTGKPKGVMLSHDNFTWMSHRFMDHIKCSKGKERVISYLPLAHIAPQLLDVFTVMAFAGSCWFAQPNALKGSLLETLREVHPTIFLGVPRVWDKIAENMQLVMRDMTGFKAWIRSWALGIGLKGNLNKQSGGSGTPLGWTIANMAVFNKIRKLLGLDECHCRLTGSAPISQETLTYFMSVNLPIYELYGMTECCGTCTLTTDDTIRFRAAGIPLPGLELRTRISDGPDNGELQVKGRCLMMGYIGDPINTAKAFTRDGYLRTGDMGHITEEGFVYITGRMKEMIVTSSGDKIAPVPMESIIKDGAPIISNAIIIGEQQEYLVCLVTLKVEFDDQGLPTDKLNATARAICTDLNIEATTVTDLRHEQKVLNTIQQAIDKANKSVTVKQHKIVKWSILDSDFSIPGGELSSTLKIKRIVVANKYSDIIEMLYSN